MIFILHEHIYRLSSLNLITQPYITTHVYKFHEIHTFTLFVEVIKINNQNLAKTHLS